jgi:hypothetical protein
MSKNTVNKIEGLSKKDTHLEASMDLDINLFSSYFSIFLSPCSHSEKCHALARGQTI